MTKQEREDLFPQSFQKARFDLMHIGADAPLARYIQDLESYVSRSEQEKMDNFFNGTSGKGGGK